MLIQAEAVLISDVRALDRLLYSYYAYMIVLSVP